MFLLHSKALLNYRRMLALSGVESMMNECLPRKWSSETLYHSERRVRGGDGGWKMKEEKAKAVERGF